MDDEVEETLARRILAARAEGCPVATDRESDAHAMAHRALRRWRSFEQRGRSRSPTLDARIEDLAKCLRDTYERRPRLTGSLMIDYRWLASELARILDAAMSARPPASKR